MRGNNLNKNNKLKTIWKEKYIEGKEYKGPTTKIHYTNKIKNKIEKS